MFARFRKYVLSVWIALASGAAAAINYVAFRGATAALQASIKVFAASALLSRFGGPECKHYIRYRGYGQPG